MNTRILWITLLLPAMVLSSLTLPAVQAAPVAHPALHARPTTNGVLLTWHLPAPTLQTTKEGTLRVVITGLPQWSVPGEPEVPYLSTLVAVPAQAELRLDILKQNTSSQTIAAALSRAPEPRGVRFDGHGYPMGGAFQPATPHPFNHPLVEVSEAGILRGVRLVRVTIFPVRPAGNRLLVTRQGQIRLRFQTANAPARIALRADDRFFFPILRQMVANPEHIVLPPPNEARPPTPPAQPAATRNVAIIEVTHPGITQIRYEDLATAGFPVSRVNPANLHLEHHGVEVAVEWDGDADTAFEPGERLLFLAVPQPNRWSRFDTYLLSESTAPGLRMTSRSADPTGLPGSPFTITQHLEDNRLYTPECLCGHLPAGWDGDRWAWDMLSSGGTTQVTYTFDLPTASAGFGGTLTLWLIGTTDPAAAPDHRVAFTLNGTPLGESRWDGQALVTPTLSLPAGTLQAGGNVLQIQLLDPGGGTVQGLYVDAFQIAYTPQGNLGHQALFQGGTTPGAYTIPMSHTLGLRAYDISDPTAPVRLTGVVTTTNSARLGDPTGSGRRYALTNQDGIRSPARVRLKETLRTAYTYGAHLILITPQDFVNDLLPLMEQRIRQGLLTDYETLQAIYDNYADGIPSPEAIRAYLLNAYTKWAIRPTYALLVGDGTFDPKQYQPTSRPSLLPPYLADVDPWAGETAADNRFVTLDGNDPLPDLFLGRLPVNSKQELQTVVSKILAYENATPALWASNVALIADQADADGNYPAEAEYLITSTLQTPYQPIRLYLQGGTTAAQLRSQLFHTWNNGTGIMIYQGQASVHQWSLAYLFHLNDIATLNNGNRLPILLEMTAFTGYFQHPGLDTLDESLLRADGRGVVAAWGATGLAVNTGHRELAGGFLNAVVQQTAATLGQAVNVGQTRLWANVPTSQNLLDTFVLLGDPAMPIQLVYPHHLFLPLITR